MWIAHLKHWCVVLIIFIYYYLFFYFTQLTALSLAAASLSKTCFKKKKKGKCKSLTSENKPLIQCVIRGPEWIVQGCEPQRWPLRVSSLKKKKKGGPSLPRIMEVNICRCRALQMCWGFGTCLCRILCRTERIRMKYWVHLWISGAERPLVGASACIFSWWKPLDGSFLLAASLNSESQKCNASWKKKKKIPSCSLHRWQSGNVFLLLQLKI